jgi:LmbE family N-acetylglucosaminyl deacetylase
MNRSGAAHRAKAANRLKDAVLRAGSGLGQAGRVGKIVALNHSNRSLPNKVVNQARSQAAGLADSQVGYLAGRRANNRNQKRNLAVAARPRVVEEISADEKDAVVTAAAAMIPKTEPEGWEEQQIILVVLAHPDDPEFFCGATIARWVSMGHTVHYCLLTRGDKGVRDRSADPLELASARELEQRFAANVLGVEDVVFLEFQDGYLVPDLSARCAVTRMIRRYKPDVVVSCDPTYIFGENSINHPDHRAAGQIVVDAVFPAAGNPLYFPELIKEGLEPHAVKEVWLSVTGQPNTTIDVSCYWEKKIEALHSHITQIGDMSQLDERLRSRRTPDSSPEAPRYEEKFRRFKFR